MATKTKTRNFRIKVQELTVLKKTGELTDPITGTVLGIQQGLGTIAFEDEVLSENEISPILIEAYDSGDHPSHEAARRKIEEVKDGPRESLEKRLGVPIDGYDEMSEDDIVGVMRHLPSGAIQRLKEYEADRDNRERIVTYNIGFGESPVDRQEGRVSSDLAEADTEKDVGRLKTREVTDTKVTPGEGITGTGDPQIAYGESADEEEGEGDIKGSNSKKVVRRGRRDRQANPKSGAPKGAGGGSSASAND